MPRNRKRAAKVGGGGFVGSVILRIVPQILSETFGDAKEWPDMIKWIISNAYWAVLALTAGLAVLLYFWDDIKAIWHKRSIGDSDQSEDYEPTPDYDVTDAIHDILRQFDPQHVTVLKGIRDMPERQALRKIVDILQEYALRGRIRVWGELTEYTEDGKRKDVHPTLIAKERFSEYGFNLSPDGMCRMIWHIEKGTWGDKVWFAPMLLRGEIVLLFGLPIQETPKA